MRQIKGSVSSTFNQPKCTGYCQNVKMESSGNSQHPQQVPEAFQRYNFKFTGRNFNASIINNIFPVDFKINRVTPLLKVILERT